MDIRELQRRVYPIMEQAGFRGSDIGAATRLMTYGLTAWYFQVDDIPSLLCIAHAVHAVTARYRAIEGKYYPDHLTMSAFTTALELETREDIAHWAETLDASRAAFYRDVLVELDYQQAIAAERQAA